jgi:hypothetical protein
MTNLSELPVDLPVPVGVDCEVLGIHGPLNQRGWRSSLRLVLLS